MHQNNFSSKREAVSVVCMFLFFFGFKKCKKSKADQGLPIADLTKNPIII